ncbi:hypothetical protein JVT61DRAFT_10466 [Boletus reticuloceps]|uniref:INO80 complex subunit B-like conserved region domain-containing protein n=1 Tax=Boletus reticuloceps TaxID=495285 RepID=A0A8I2YY72_9AGAM|nr:hypothetical protein JVT61DRAFT_10466 [Boletus reticuloceps]
MFVPPRAVADDPPSPFGNVWFRAGWSDGRVIHLHGGSEHVQSPTDGMNRSDIEMGDESVGKRDEYDGTTSEEDYKIIIIKPLWARDEFGSTSPTDDIESDELAPPPSPHKPRLKFKFKLPQILSPNESSSRAVSTPSGEPSQPPSRRGISRDIDIESEDDDDDDDQAVLASVVDSSYVSLSESSRRKKQLIESEIALRREETARKRKNLTEKKLEDEKAETINWLLKKQSKSKNKRNVLSTADDRTPADAQSTRDGSEAPEGEIPESIELIPTIYRWISTTKPLPGDAEPGSRDETLGRMKLRFSVPVSVLPPDATLPSETRLPPAEAPVCDVSGCERVRKYRLVRDWLKGACGMEHLKILEHQMDVV